MLYLQSWKILGFMKAEHSQTLRPHLISASIKCRQAAKPRLYFVNIHTPKGTVRRRYSFRLLICVYFKALQFQFQNLVTSKNKLNFYEFLLMDFQGLYFKTTFPLQWDLLSHIIQFFLKGIALNNPTFPMKDRDTIKNIRDITTLGCDSVMFSPWHDSSHSLSHPTWMWLCGT